MPIFPSQEWCEAAIRIANSDPESALAGEGFVGDFGAVIEAEPGKLDQPFIALIETSNGRIGKLTVLDDPDDLDDIEPAYLARAPYSVWKSLLQGKLDPVEAVLRRRIAVQGDIQQLIERMKYKGIADRVLAQLGTTFADDQVGK